MVLLLVGLVSVFSYVYLGCFRFALSVRTIAK